MSENIRFPQSREELVKEIARLKKAYEPTREYDEDIHSSCITIEAEVYGKDVDGHINKSGKKESMMEKFRGLFFPTLVFYVILVVIEDYFEILPRYVSVHFKFEIWGLGLLLALAAGIYSIYISKKNIKDANKTIYHSVYSRRDIIAKIPNHFLPEECQSYISLEKLTRILETGRADSWKELYNEFLTDLRHAEVMAKLDSISYEIAVTSAELREVSKIVGEINNRTRWLSNQMTWRNANSR